ncbi:MAG: hypothetical protein M1837_006475 [Sclerophora amabilis]|nr:MAG: hypothetical protein M1837_006475 [Sclerophora amabilis]
MVTVHEGESQIKIVHIPWDYCGQDWSSLPDCVSGYKGLRLLALQLAPEAFASTYEWESGFTADTWKGRLLNPLANIFVAVHNEHSHDELCKRWVAMISMLGPQPAGTKSISASTSPWDSLASDKSSNAVDDPVRAIWHFHLNTLFTLPAARRRGLGCELIRHAIAHVQQKARQNMALSVRISVIVDSCNLSTKALYEKCGFRVTGETAIPTASTGQGTISNGDNYPSPGRTGLTMEQEIGLA